MSNVAELFSRAQRSHRTGDLAAAETLCRHVLEADPYHADALQLLGVLSHQAGRQETAVNFLRRAIGINPNIADYHFNLGIALVVKQDFAEAAESFRQALNIKPNDALGHYNLGNALAKQMRLRDAEESFRQALRLNPNLIEAKNDLGHALFWQGDLVGATENYRLAVQMKPERAEGHVDLGSALLWQGQFAEAGACFERALVLDPRNRNGLWHRAWLRLLHGDFAGGWQDYEYRPFLSSTSARTFERSRWDGSPLHGKTTLVYAEQGLGDTIQFARYLPMVKHQGGVVLFECQPALAPLFVGFAGVDRVIPGGAPVPPFDVQIPLLSLPLLFGTDLATIPSDAPYLRRAARRKPAGSSELHVGIAWQGSLNQRTQKGDRRCLALSQLAPLAQIQGVRLFSLQFGPAARELDSLGLPVTDLGSHFHPDSLADLADAMLNKDLVVTIDSAVAHLAGALGVPVWTLLTFAPDWRWLLERSDSPWYPTMRLFRQTRLGDWNEVVERVCQALKDIRPVAGPTLPK